MDFSGLSKVNFPEITLCYVNQEQVSLVISGEQTIYLQYVVCGQVMPLTNSDPSINLDIHKFEDNRFLLYVPIYNRSTGLYGALKKNKIKKMLGL